MDYKEMIQALHKQGRHVWDKDDFDYDKVKVGDLVTQAVVNQMMDLLPPVSWSCACAQVGEPYSHIFDEKTGKLRPTFSTFKMVVEKSSQSLWQYCGNCFHGETVERGIIPHWMQKEW